MILKPSQKDTLSIHSRTPSASTGSSVGRNRPKPSSKCSRVESSVDSVSDQAQLSELARSSQDTKLARINMKRRKMELQLELERVCVQEHECKLKHEEAREQHVADEWALLLKQQMQDKELAHKEKELAHKERMIQHQLELA